MAKLIFITGGSASGKTTVANNIVEELGDKITLISQDMFYKPTQSNDTNYDIPSAFDWELQLQVFEDLRNGKPTKVPVYSFEKHDRIGWETIVPKDTVIFEGLFTFWNFDLTAMADLQIFVDTPSDTRLARRLKRDVNERGRDPLMVIERWQKDVQPSFLKYIHIMKEHADIIIPWSKVNKKSVRVILAAVEDI